MNQCLGVEFLRFRPLPSPQGLMSAPIPHAILAVSGSFLWSIAHVGLVEGDVSIEDAKRERSMPNGDSQLNEFSLGLGFIVMATTVMVVSFAYIDRIL